MKIRLHAERRNQREPSNGAGYGTYSGGDAFSPRRFVRHGDVQTVIRASKARQQRGAPDRTTAAA